MVIQVPEELYTEIASVDGIAENIDVGKAWRIEIGRDIGRGDDREAHMEIFPFPSYS